MMSTSTSTTLNRLPPGIERTDEMAAAVEAVAAAMRICRAVQAALVTEDTVTKKDRSPVTVADFAAQAAVSLLLQNRFPDIPMVGEESADSLRAQDGAELADQVTRHVAAALRNSECPQSDPGPILDAIDACNDAGGAQGRRWVLDPIDGTKGYLRRGQYAVALGLLEDGVPVLGVLGCPSMPRLVADDPSGGGDGCVFLAERGAGAYQLDVSNDHEAASAFGDLNPIHSTDLTDAGDAVFCESVEAAHSSHDRHQAIAEVLGVTKPSFRIDSQCKYAAVARGQASIYLRLPTSETYREKIWDHAAGWMVVTEAGGRVSDIHGNDLDFSIGRTLENNRGVVATNGHLHEAVIDAIARTATDA